MTVEPFPCGKNEAKDLADALRAAVQELNNVAGDASALGLSVDYTTIDVRELASPIKKPRLSVRIERIEEI